MIFALSACGGDDATEKAVDAVAAGEVTATTSTTAASASDSLRERSEAESPGHAVYEHYCADCHDRGPGHPGTMRLAVRLETGVLRNREDLAPAYVKFIVRNGYQMMPPFRPSEIPDSQLDDLANYVSARTIKAMGQSSE